ncbi:MAG TPA: ankyrin repeat domain-containing protein [Candidatus Paceibacterota bacterium]
MTKSASPEPVLEELLRSAAESFFPAEEEPLSINVATRSSEGDTPLHLFTWRGDVAAAKVLIRAGADVNAIGDMGETPLHVALRKGNEALALLFLEAGAKINIRSEFNETPQEAAMRIGGRLAEIFTNRSSRRNATRGA